MGTHGVPVTMKSELELDLKNFEIYAGPVL